MGPTCGDSSNCSNHAMAANRKLGGCIIPASRAQTCCSTPLQQQQQQQHSMAPAPDVSGNRNAASRLQHPNSTPDLRSDTCRHPKVRWQQPIAPWRSSAGNSSFLCLKEPCSHAGPKRTCCVENPFETATTNGRAHDVGDGRHSACARIFSWRQMLPFMDSTF